MDKALAAIAAILQAEGQKFTERFEQTKNPDDYKQAKNLFGDFKKIWEDEKYGVFDDEAPTED